MKKNGFTLVELLAVIIILAILYLFVMPKVTDLIKDGNKTDEYIIQNKIITAAKEYTSNYDTRFLNDFINVGYSKYISKEDLINNKLLDENELDSIGFFKVKVTLKEDNKLEYTISYDDSEKVILSVNLDGGSMISNPSGEYDVGSTITLNTPTKTNYEFSHWSIEVGNSILSGNKLTIGNINTTIKANWIKKVTLTIDLNGGTGNNQDGIYSSNTTITLEEPMKDDYVFAGWKIVSGDAIVSGNNITFGLEDASVKALWVKETYEFAYTGSEQTFTAPVTGYYKLEVWGASGGDYSTTYTGGYGGYTTGIVKLDEGETIYINVGGRGKDKSDASITTGGYNGGGNGAGATNAIYSASGGGATHIATKSGLLSTLENSKDEILIVAGGGGATSYQNQNSTWTGVGGSAGGYIGNNGTNTQTNWVYGSGGTQTAGGASGGGNKVNNEDRGTDGSFAQGGNGLHYSAGGGGGFYGGGASNQSGAGGGSSYIGNSKLTKKIMYCYNCQTSNDENTKTISVQCKNSNPLDKCAKIDNGYAKITYVNINNNSNEYQFNSINDIETFVVPKTGRYKLEVWGAQGGNGKTSMDYNQIGGYGGYSKGEVYLNENDKLYVVVGEQGKTGIGDGVSRVTVIGGYNGGANNLAGYSYSTDNYFGSGGGATHIATSTGLLSNLENNKDSILIVAGGGGGSFYFLLQSYYHHSVGGSGGGFEGQDVQEYYSSSDTTEGYKATGGKQQVDSGNSYLIYGTFGKANAPTDNGLGGGGGGFYGGASGSGGAGGSGYIGNSLLTNKVMYCYNCTSSSEEATKTISTTCTNKNATENCSKQGNGYAKITYLGE